MEATKQASVDLRGKLRMDGKSRAIASMPAGFSLRFSNSVKSYRIVTAGCPAIMAVTILLGDNQPAVVINTIAAMNAVVFGLLGLVLLFLDRKLPGCAREPLFMQCMIFIGSAVFLGAAFLTLL